jgi:hypothetical protein
MYGIFDHNIDRGGMARIYAAFRVSTHNVVFGTFNGVHALL